MNIGPINAATPTPLNPDGSLDVASAKRLCRRWVDIGLDGVFLLGSMGEGPFLPDAVRDAFVELALAEVGDKMTLFVSAADLSGARMLERARKYAAMGAPCVVLCLPPKVAAAAAIDAVKAIADACPCPCAYYDIPANTGTSLVLEEILDILAHPNIVALKDSSNNALLAQLLTSPDHRPSGVAILNGCEYNDVLASLLGYSGFLHGGGALTGRIVRQIRDLALTGKVDEAMAREREKCLCLARVYNRFSNPLQHTVGQKYALKLLGVLDHETVVIPQKLSDADRERVRLAVNDHRSWLA